MARTNTSNSTIDDYFSFCDDMVFIAAESGALLHMSGALTRALSPDLLDAAPQAELAPLIHPDDRLPFDEAWKRLRDAAAPMSLDVRLKTSEGSFKPFQCNARWVHAKEEVYGTLHEAAERIEKDIKIKILKALNDNLPVCLWAIDARGIFVLQDGKACETAGIKPGQFVGLNMFEIYPEEDTAGVRKALAGEVTCFVHEVDRVHWESWNMPVENERGQVTHVAGVSLDITAAKRTEQELRA